MSTEQSASVLDDIHDSISELEADPVEAEEVETSDEVSDEPDEVAESPDEPEENQEVESDEVSDESDKADEETEQKLAAPEHWDAKHKEAFNSWPKDVQEQYMERHKAMEGLMTQKTQEAAAIRNDFGDFYDRFAPMKGNLQQMGISPSQYMTSLVNADMMLAQDPISGLQHIAQQYGIDLSQFENPDYEAPQQNQELESLKRELAQIRQSTQLRDQQAAQEKQQTILSRIQDFASEKDETGSPAHPHFEDVINDMVALAQAERAMGREPDLVKLYDQAVWANPQTREKVLSSQKEAEERRRQADARKKAKDAQKASRSVRGSSVQTQKAELSLREELEAASRGEI
jgi:hypothetical protein